MQNRQFWNKGTSFATKILSRILMKKGFHALFMAEVVCRSNSELPKCQDYLGLIEV